METLKTFADGSTIGYDRGSFDDWCVYIVPPNTKRRAPRDEQYFETLLGLVKRWGPTTVYPDFVLIYEATTPRVDGAVLGKITELATSYGSEAVEVDKVYTTIYLGMVAEMNKKYTVLGKRIKRLGVHQVVHLELMPREAASFSKGKKASELNDECVRRGF